MVSYYLMTTFKVLNFHLKVHREKTSLCDYFMSEEGQFYDGWP